MCCISMKNSQFLHRLFPRITINESYFLLAISHEKKVASLLLSGCTKLQMLVMLSIISSIQRNVNDLNVPFWQLPYQYFKSSFLYKNSQEFICRSMFYFKTIFMAFSGMRWHWNQKRDLMWCFLLYFK